VSEEEQVPPTLNTIANPGEVSTQEETGPPTHILWREDSAEFVTLDGYDEENPDLEPLPEGVVHEFALIDLQARTIALDAERLDAMLHARIDVGAGAYRMKFITDVPGQQMTYVRKEKEARELTGGGSGPFPTLEAEAAATDQTVAQLAATVIYQADLIISLGAAIEGMRIGAKRAVSLAQTAEQKHAAANVNWESIAG